MVFPLYDDNTGRATTPFVNYALIALNILVFVVFQGIGTNEQFTYAFSTVPLEIITGQDIVSADLVLYMLMVGAVIVMRRKAPQIERPYRTFGYPIVPLVYLVIAGFFIIDLAILAPSTSGIGYLLVATGIPIYYVWRKGN